MKIRGHVFVVTGGASGLGEAVVKLLFDSGAKGVAIFDMSEDTANGLIAKLGDANRLLFQSVDVTDEGVVKKSLENVVAKFGGIDGVVQCAGIGIPCRILSGRGTVHPLDAFQSVVNVNLIGTFNVLRFAASQMSKQAPQTPSGERGVFIHVASVAAFEGQIGQAAYSASKAGVAAMTLPVARELAQHGIRVLTIAPGLFKTPMLAMLPEKAQQSLVKQVPFPHRLGEPAEFASLCGQIIENEYLNGEVIRIDGSIRMGAM